MKPIKLLRRKQQLYRSNERISHHLMKRQDNWYLIGKDTALTANKARQLISPNGSKNQQPPHPDGTGQRQQTGGSRNGEP